MRFYHSMSHSARVSEGFAAIAEALRKAAKGASTIRIVAHEYDTSANRAFINNHFSSKHQKIRAVSGASSRQALSLALRFQAGDTPIRRWIL